MTCKYCFYCDEAEKRSQSSYGMMTEKTLKNVIRKTVLSAKDYCSIAFQGGEPTLCGIDFFQKAIDYVNQYNHQGIPIDFAIQTNGYGLNPQWCQFFADHKFLVGVSVDGTEAIHNTYRQTQDGGPTYRQIEDNIKLLKKYGVEYHILTVVHKQVAENIGQIYKVYRKKGWDYMQFIACLDPLGETKGTKEYSLLPETYGQFLIDLFDLWFKDFLQGNPPYIRQFENYISVILGQVPEACEHRGICSIQTIVEADGSVFPCDFYAIDQYKLGNFNTDRLENIYAAANETVFVSRSKCLPEQCKTCQWFRLCRGGCYRNRLDENTDRRGMNYFCKGYQMFFETCYGRLVQGAEKVSSLHLSK